ncbi:virginiamycin B lyase family protein [Myxococcus stipitatus]|uniref:virginiamycin B lyase family protein n=1 Tax=Myxococcus stipitatus TaxID=83455 RepID=UPI003CD04C03
MRPGRSSSLSCPRGPMTRTSGTTTDTPSPWSSRPSPDPSEFRESFIRDDGRGPYNITTGADGALWFTLNKTNALGRMTLGGTVPFFPLPTPGAGPVGATAGSDAIRFVEIIAGQIGRMALDGTVSRVARLGPRRP